MLVILGGIILSLIAGAWPAIKAFGFRGSGGRQRWEPVADPPVLGALGPIYGTLMTSFLAMAIALPVGFGIAIFLMDCPQWLRRPIGTAIELLAGIPSIIYGMWGLFVLAPFLAHTSSPS